MGLGQGGAGRPAAGAAVRWGWAATLATAAVSLVALLWRTGGTFVYVIDDPAIHLAVARRLAFDGTWGVVAGEFQSATSSPLWVLLLAPAEWVIRGRLGELVPLVFALAAGLVVVRLLGPDLDVLRPGRRRPLDALAACAVPVLLLALPALAFTGMEHTLHMALVLAAGLAAERRWAVPQPGTGPPAVPRWAPFGLLAAATLVRGESAFLAAGLGAALLVAPNPPTRGAVPVGRSDEPAGRAQAVPGRGDERAGGVVGRSSAVPGQRDEHRAAVVGRSLGVALATAPGEPNGGRAPVRWGERLAVAIGLGLPVLAAFGAVAAVNLAYGQDPLPNSVMVKAFGDRADTRRSLGAALERFTADPLLAALLIVALVALLATLTTAVDRGDVHRLRFPAAVTVVAGSFHVVLGAVDPSLRYESYLVALGVWVLLRLAAVVDAGSLGGLRGLRRFRRVPAALVILAVVPFATMQARATATVPHDARVMADQRYQVARFLDRAYEADSIAISELGYIGLYHDGPLTDVYGLGDHQVARARIDERADARFWRGLQRRRGFRVVAAYPFSLACEEPEGWIAVASWHTPDAFYPEIVFWAAVPAEVAPLRRHLEAFEAELPDTVEVSYNELAELAAAQALQAPEG